MHYDDICVECHGGLTYSSGHLPLQEDKDMWWIGFDCAHYTDARDFEALSKYFPKSSILAKIDEYRRGQFGTIKTLEFCEEECKNIVDQILNRKGTQ